MKSRIWTVILNPILIACLMVQVFGQDQPGAIWMRSPHQSAGRGGKTVKWLIIHGTAGGSSARGIGSWFQNPSAQASTHYIVDQAGVIVQSVREADTAWANGVVENGHDPWWSHTGNPNGVTISIEHVKTSTSNSNVLTQAQQTASFNLIRGIINRHPGIRKAWANTNGGITGHYSISPSSRRNCPGPYPWNELFTFLGGGGGHNPSPGHDPGHQCTGVVRSSVGLRVRAQPNTGSAVINTLTNGQRVGVSGRVTGQNIEGNTSWFKVGAGYASGKYLQVSGGPNWCH